jgi:hypothetical protein
MLDDAHFVATDIQDARSGRPATNGLILRAPYQTLSTELATILDFIRPGDTLVVVKLDRLGRSTRDVLNLVHELESKGAHLRVLEPEVRPGARSVRWS